MASIGIDLGTTTTLIATARSIFGTDIVEPEIFETKQIKYDGGMPNEQFMDNLLSYAYFPATGEELVGAEATTLADNKDDFERSARAVKRWMGRSILLPEPIGRTPAEISALYLRYVLNAMNLRQSLSDRDELTITVPASFTTNQRRDTLYALDKAADMLGLQHLKGKRGRVLISEPVAALLAFLAHDLKNAEALRKLDLSHNPLVLVYDMGGGTLDLTIVQLGWRDISQSKTLDNVRFEIKELNRYNGFGGEDFDHLVAKYLLDKLIEVFPELKDVELSSQDQRSLRFKLTSNAERLKKELNLEIAWSGVEDTNINFTLNPIRIQGKEYHLTDIEVSGLDYITWVAPFLQHRQDQKNAVYPIESLLYRAGMKKENIDYFLLVGGMGRFLPLQEALKSYWKYDSNFMIHPSPDHAVVLGAAVYSHLKATYPDFEIEEPSADAYYVRRARGFGLLLGRGHRQHGEKREYELAADGDRLRLQIFAGDSPPTNETIESIYPTLVYQGGTVIPLGKIYPRGTKVWIQMYYHDNDSSKVPYLDIWVEHENNLIASKSYSEFMSE
jgi:molecular chaperone DnaK